MKKEKSETDKVEKDVNVVFTEFKNTEKNKKIC